MKKFNSKALTGNRIVDKNVIIKRLDSYNSDIEEIDTILFKIINKIKKRNKQTILIYTSDHGESIFQIMGMMLIILKLKCPRFHC